MSTRSMICMKDEGDKYKCIYCHSDGYLEHNGAILIDHYKDKEKLMELLELGSISYLQPNVHPDPTRPHSFDYDQRQEGVVVAYCRDRGETKEEARLLTLDDLWDDQSWIEYVYLFDEDEEWKYLSYPLSVSQIKDVAEDLDKYYKSLGLKYRPKNCYGILDEDDIAKIKKQQDSQGELWKNIFKNQETKS